MGRGRVVLATGLGFLVVALLMGMSLRGIQQAIEQDVRLRLDSAGHHWAKVEVSGQDVRLSGTPPTAAAAEHAVALTDATASATWLGPLPSIASVETAFGPPAAPGGPGWVFRRLPDAVWLTGRVRDAGTLERVRSAAYDIAVSSTPHATVRSTLFVDPDIPDATAAIDGALSILQRCPRGRVWCEDGTVSVACEVPTAAQKPELQVALDRLRAQVPVGTADVYISAEAEACDAAYQAIANRRVRFVPGRSAIQPQSAAVIYDLARALRACPGSVRLTVHSDNTAPATLGVHLTQLRAEALRDALAERGVERNRLVPLGMGPHRPIQSNATREGREANRRIEIHTVRAHDG